MMRLAFGMLIFVGGVPWWLSHEVISGFFYFLMFLWIARRRHWSFRPVPTSPVPTTAPIILNRSSFG